MEIDRDKFIVNSIDGKARLIFNNANVNSVHTKIKDYYYTDFCNRWTKEQLIKKAKERYGVTSDPVRSLWLLEDGSLLDGINDKGLGHGGVSNVYSEDPINSIFLANMRQVFFAWRTNSIRLVTKEYREGINNNKQGLNLNIWCNIKVTIAQWERIRSIIGILGEPVKIFYDCKLQNERIRHYGETYELNEVKKAYNKLSNNI